MLVDSPKHIDLFVTIKLGLGMKVTVITLFALHKLASKAVTL